MVQLYCRERDGLSIVGHGVGPDSVRSLRWTSVLVSLSLSAVEESR